MEFITVEQFQEQPLEVQKVFIDWWQPNIGDIFDWIKPKGEVNNDLRKMECCNSENIVEITKCFKGIEEGNRIPLFTEGQLRKFIEDKTSCRNIELTINAESEEYDLFCFKEVWSWCEDREYNELGTNVLQAYWKVACMIAKEG